VQRVPLVSIAGRCHLPTERVSLLAADAEQRELLRAIEASPGRRFALQAVEAEAGRTGIVPAAEAPMPTVGDGYVLCELLTTRGARGYGDSGDSGEGAVVASAIALSRCRVERLLSGPSCPLMPAGARPPFSTLEVAPLVDTEPDEVSSRTADFERLLEASDAIDVLANGIMRDAAVATAEQKLWGYILDSRRLVEQLFLTDDEDDHQESSPVGRLEIPGMDISWLREDPFEVMSALAPPSRSRIAVGAREDSLVQRHGQSKALLERAWRRPSAGHVALEVANARSPSRAELFSFAVASTLTPEEFDACSTLRSKRDVLFAESTLDRLNACAEAIYDTRSWLAARCSLANVFCDCD